MRTVSEIAKEIRYVTERITDLDLGIYHGDIEYKLDNSARKLELLPASYFKNVYLFYIEALETLIIEQTTCDAITAEAKALDDNNIFKPVTLHERDLLIAKDYMKMYAMKFLGGGLSMFDRMLALSYNN
jgi:hypothetical protein